MRLRVLAANGTPLTANEADRVEVQLAPVLGAGTPAWQPLTLTFNAVDGGLEAELPAPADTAFLRAQERTAP